MAELHLILVKDIGGEATEADLELDVTQLDSLSSTEQGICLYDAYQKCRSTLRDIEVELGCDQVKNLISFKPRDIPVE